ncbi:MAG: hypothetical protein AAF447_27070, partial [Myxococcota bacterium]
PPQTLETSGLPAPGAFQTLEAPGLPGPGTFQQADAAADALRDQPGPMLAQPTLMGAGLPPSMVPPAPQPAPTAVRTSDGGAIGVEARVGGSPGAAIADRVGTAMQQALGDAVLGPTTAGTLRRAAGMVGALESAPEAAGAAGDQRAVQAPSIRSAGPASPAAVEARPGFITIQGDPVTPLPEGQGLSAVADDVEERGQASADRIRGASMSARAVAQEAQRAAEEAAAAYDEERRDAEAAMRESAARFREANAALEGGQLDQGRWWARQTTGQRIASAGALALGAIAGIFRGDGKNSAVEAVLEQVDQDLDQQEADMQRALQAGQAQADGERGILSFWMDRLGNIDAARNAAQASALARYEQEIRVLERAAQDEGRAATIAGQGDQIRARREELMLRGQQQFALQENARRRRARTVRAGGAAGGPVDPVRQQALGAALIKAKIPEMRRDIESARSALGRFGPEDALFARFGGNFGAYLNSDGPGRRAAADVMSLAERVLRAEYGAAVTRDEIQRLYNRVIGNGSRQDVVAGINRIERRMRAIEVTIRSGFAPEVSEAQRARVAQEEAMSPALPSNDAAADEREFAPPAALPPEAGPARPGGVPTSRVRRVRGY